MKNKILALLWMFESLFAEGLLNPSARLDEQLGTVDLFAKVFYWVPSETLDWAFTLNSTNPNAIVTDYRSLVFDWAPGFSVGFGINMDHDEWDMRAGYTWFNAQASDHTEGPVTSAFLGARTSLVELISLFGTGKARLNLHYNMFNIDLGRPFFISDCFSLKPTLGIKGGWITQKIVTRWETPNFLLTPLLEAREDLLQRFQGGGPKGGVLAKWFLNRSFCIVSQFESGYLWGHWSIEDTYIDNLNTIVFVDTTTRNYGAFVLHSFLGAGWECNFNCNQSHMAIQIGYEIEDWFNHLQIFTNTSGSQNNNLILQGFNFSMNLDF